MPVFSVRTGIRDLVWGSPTDRVPGSGCPEQRMEELIPPDTISDVLQQPRSTARPNSPRQTLKRCYTNGMNESISPTGGVFFLESSGHPASFKVCAVLSLSDQLPVSLNAAQPHDFSSINNSKQIPLQPLHRASSWKYSLLQFHPGKQGDLISRSLQTTTGSAD